MEVMKTFVTELCCRNRYSYDTSAVTVTGCKKCFSVLVVLQYYFEDFSQPNRSLFSYVGLVDLDTESQILAQVVDV